MPVRHCFGLASLEHGVPITHETVFNLASVSKQFTAMLVLMLAEEVPSGVSAALLAAYLGLVLVVARNVPVGDGTED